jgi:hypothetical protein
MTDETTAIKTERQLVLDMLPWLADAANVKYIDQQAAKLLWDGAHIEFPHNACAATQSAILIEAGINIKRTLGALALDNLLKSRGWKVITVGQQQAGDIGTTCIDHPRPGIDHVYMVLRVINAQEDLIVDNQEAYAHVRYTSGHGKSPTTYFLRAP